MIDEFLNSYTITSLLVIFLITLYIYSSNIFYKIVLKTGTPIFGTIFIAYKFYKCAYSTNIYKAIKEVNSITKNPNKEIIGIYYDDPAKVEASKQRFIIGIVLNGSQMDIDEHSENEFKKKDYKMICMTKINNAVLAEYPCNTMLSILLGVWLVYPKLMKFIKKHKLCAHPYIEYYKDKMTHFVVPMCEQDKFYVQEYHDTIKRDPYYTTLKKLK